MASESTGGVNHRAEKNTPQSQVKMSLPSKLITIHMSDCEDTDEPIVHKQAINEHKPDPGVTILMNEWSSQDSREEAKHALGKSFTVNPEAGEDQESLNCPKPKFDFRVYSRENAQKRVSSKRLTTSSFRPALVPRFPADHLRLPLPVFRPDIVNW